MISRNIKRLIIALGYALVFASISAFIVFVFFPPQGLAPGPDRPDTDPLQIIRSKEIYLSDTERDVFAEIDNPNDSYGLSSFEYVFVFTSSNGDTRRVRGSTYILPGETRFVTELSQNIPEKYSLQTVNITPRSRWSELKINPPRLVVQNLETRTSQNNRFFILSGEVINRSPHDLETVDINIALENGSGTLVGTQSTRVRVLESSKTRDFQVRWPSGYADKRISNIRVRPSTNALNLDNILNISEDEKGEFR